MWDATADKVGTGVSGASSGSLTYSALAYDENGTLYAGASDSKIYV